MAPHTDQTANHNHSQHHSNQSPTRTDRDGPMRDRHLTPPHGDSMLGQVRYRTYSDKRMSRMRARPVIYWFMNVHQGYSLQRGTCLSWNLIIFTTEKFRTHWRAEGPRCNHITILIRLQASLSFCRLVVLRFRPRTRTAISRVRIPTTVRQSGREVRLVVSTFITEGPFAMLHRSISILLIVYGSCSIW